MQWEHIINGFALAYVFGHAIKSVKFRFLGVNTVFIIVLGTYVTAQT